MTTATKRKLWIFAGFALGWTMLGLLFFGQAMAEKLAMGDPTPWWHFLVTWVAGFYIFGLLSIGVLWLGRRFPIQRRNWLRHTALHLIFSVCFALLDFAIAAAIYPPLGLMPAVFKNFASTFAFLVAIDFNNAILGYWTVLAAQAGIRYYRAYQERERQALRLELQASELKTQLARAQLNALKMQLQPHFLFNTLNAITVLVRQRKSQVAEEMLGRLSDLLRCVLEDVDAQEVPLRRELEYLELYLSIQQVRFQDRLKIDILAASEILDAAVPHMVLQPLVENAIRHGIGARTSAGKLQISAVHSGGSLVVKIEDDGPGFAPASAAPSAGIGLSNTRERLRQLYGDRAELRTGNRDRGGAIVTLAIPYRPAPDFAAAEMTEVHAVQSPDR